MRIALLGAPGTGKSQFSAALNLALKATGWPAILLTANQIDLTRIDLTDLTLLMGLKVANESALKADQSIRTALSQSSASFEVLYGSTQERLEQTLVLIEKRLVNLKIPLTARPARIDVKTKPWVWNCEKCSDHKCEHTLLTDLLQKRLTAA